MKKLKLKSCLAALLTVLLVTGCTKAAGTQPAASLVQMTEYNSSLEMQPSIDFNSTTYEIFVYSFRDSDKDGIGDINGIRNKLDYIQDLGFDRIWLTPVCPSPTYHKYDVTDYRSIDPKFGTLEDYEALIKECHDRGMLVFFDLVLNHTSSEHEWFKTACDYLRNTPADLGYSVNDLEACPYIEYYYFSKQPGEGYAPLEGTDWYYEARFWSGMPDLDLDNPRVREEIADIMKYWLEKGVDGFRLDAVTSYYTGNPDANTAFLKWLCDTGRSFDPDCYFVGEAWIERPIIALLYRSGINSLFNFPFADNSGIIRNLLNGTYAASDYVKAINTSDEIFRQSNEIYTDAPFYTNHDIARSAGYYRTDKGPKTKMAYALSLLMSGNSFVYYGEELGMKGSGKDENKRAPMYWSDDPSYEGMCTGPEGMDDFDMKFPPYDVQKDDELSIYNWFKQVIKVRRSFPAIACGGTRGVEEMSDKEAVTLIKEREGCKAVMLVINLGPETKAIAVTEPGFDTLSAVLNTNEDKILLEDGTITIPSMSIAVLTQGE